MTKNVLLLGESWITAETHYKGFDQFNSSSYNTGAKPFLDAIDPEAFDVTFMPAHDAALNLPFEIGGLDKYDAIIISDVGANTFLLHPDVFVRSQARPNRLKLLRDWTLNGGGLMMVGGYLTFQGIDGRGRWRNTPVEEVLPVTCHPWDDRIEVPEGFSAKHQSASDHPILEGLDGEWPILLGLNEVLPKSGAKVLATLPESEGGHPLLVCGEYGKGRSVAWTSDMGPHWVPPAFIAWPGYRHIWHNTLKWLTRS
ncbi:glutamine amidotransferase [Loktanella salsilacus]|jgi:uncharacterized membrane protein|uniref:glutamine amidotransferase n=1 Tax=Loktanella salsilacus TaxID=195913 RepID=UPI003735D34C